MKMTTEMRLGDKSKIQSKNYEEFKAKRDEEKKARQKRIEERLMLLRMKRFADPGNVPHKENVLKGRTVSTKGSNRCEQTISKPLHNKAIQSSQIISSKAPRDIGCKTILKRKHPEVNNSVASLNKNLKESKFPNANKKLQERPKARTSNKIHVKPDVESRKRQLELWRIQKLEKTKETNGKAKSVVHKTTSALNNSSSKRHLVKKPDAPADKQFTSAVKKPKADREVQNVHKLANQTQLKKRISLSSKHLAEKKVYRGTVATKTSGNKDVETAAKQPRRGGSSYTLDLKGRVSAIRPGDVMNVSKSFMKEKLNKWLEGKGKSPSTCRRHLSCYGLHSSTPIGGRVKLEVRTAVKENRRNQEISVKENVEPLTESKIRVKRVRDEVQDCNIFRSSRVFFKCREVTNQKSAFHDGGSTLIDTPMRKMFIVTPVRRSTRKSCVPVSLKEHDILVETVDELSADVKQMSIFKPNKCLIQSDDVSTNEPTKKQLKFDDDC